MVAAGDVQDDFIQTFHNLHWDFGSHIHGFHIIYPILEFFYLPIYFRQDRVHLVQQRSHFLSDSRNDCLISSYHIINSLKIFLEFHKRKLRFLKCIILYAQLMLKTMDPLFLLVMLGSHSLIPGISARRDYLKSLLRICIRFMPQRC